MTAPSAAIVQKLWSYCNVLLDAGLTYLDYTEQLTYLLFLKMAHERSQEPWNQKSPVPAEFSWAALVAKDGTPSRRTTATPSKPSANVPACSA